MKELQKQTSSFELDLYDRKILFELDKNARLSTAQIAKKIKRSKQFVDYRIKRLEEEHILLGYATVIDYAKLGYTSIRIYFKFHNLNPDKQKKIENDLAKDKEVWWFVTASGKWEVCFATGFKNILDFYPYWDKIMKKHRQYIKEKMVVIYTHVKQYPKSFLMGKMNIDQGTMVGDSQESVPCTTFDLKLLKIISDKARMSLLELARQLNTSPQVVKNHLKKLEKNKIILRYRALINLFFMGYHYYKAYIEFINTERLPELQQYCLQHPYILNINRTIGGRDFEIEVPLESFEDFEALMNDIKEKFSDMIDYYEFIIAKEEKKMNYFPFEY